MHDSIFHNGIRRCQRIQDRIVVRRCQGIQFDFFLFDVRDFELGYMNFPVSTLAGGEHASGSRGRALGACRTAGQPSSHEFSIRMLQNFTGLIVLMSPAFRTAVEITQNFSTSLDLSREVENEMGSSPLQPPFCARCSTASTGTRR